MNASASSLPARYTRTAAALHWLLAAAILGSLSMGVYMTGLPMSPERLKLYNWHKWAGVTILALSALRLLWRLTHRPPPQPSGPRWQQMAASATHGALYVLFFGVPLAGWAYSSAAGFPVVLYGVLPLPDFAPKDRALAESFKTAHNLLAWALSGLIVLHVLAALKHHFIDHDGLLARMGLGR